MTSHAAPFVIDTRLGAPTFTQLSGRVRNLTAKRDALVAADALGSAGGVLRLVRVQAALNSATAALDAAL